MLLTHLGRSSKLAVLAGLTLSFFLALHLLTGFGDLPIPAWRVPSLYSAPDKSTDSSDSPHALPSPPELVPSPEETFHDAASDLLPCQRLEGGDDVLVVMRTGATEINDKLPAHLDTTFKCFPNSLIFSDYEEDFRGHHVHDVLKYIPDHIKQTNDDFKHYLHIQDVGRAGLDEAELSGKVSDETIGGVGKNENAGWRLDKWKFLPMVNHTLGLYPDKKWYVFIEPDTYPVWSNLLQWLPKLDPSKASYYGSEVMIGDDLFAHGGSAFVLSRPAMEIGASTYNTKTKELNDYTAGHWAGDCVLGKTLSDAGVKLTWSWPQFQGGNPSFSLNWEDHKHEKLLWCTPAISYHHLIPSEVRDLWNFEQAWIQDVQSRVVDRGLPFSLWHADMSTVLHHRDVFKQYVMPNLTKERDHWNAKPETAHPPTQDLTLSHCKAICEAIDTCLQYVLTPQGCLTGGEPRMGQSESGSSSGWMVERIEKWMNKLDRCNGKDGWIAT